jgi:2-succinyl-5-enolpyruvyl-6-hydroxy-3-cyclohexene-1-carboxylate synthase
LALDRHPEVRVHVHLDERSSAFFALGLAKALREPVAVACTSGTAAAEFFPAVVEASQSRVPLIVLTADRPPRLRGTGVNQTIDQVELYGKYVRAYLEVPVPESPNDREGWASAGRRAIDASREAVGGDGVPTQVGGPVHVNCPVDEPLTPAAAGPPEAASIRVERPGDGWVTRDPIDQIRRSIDPDSSLVLAGPVVGPGADIGALAATFRAPLIADPLSGARLPSTDRSATGASAAGIALLHSERWMGGHMPESLVLVGAAPTSRVSSRVIHEVPRLVVVQDGPLDPVPDRPDAVRIPLPPALVASAAETAGDGVIHPDSAWLEGWQRADAAARGAIDELLDSWEAPSEMQVARDLPAAIPDGGTLFVGNSMPVRDLDAFMAPRGGLRVLGNRGASGIDGLLSTALGVAASGTGPTFALLGDLSFLYDAGALLWNGRQETSLVVVVNDNGGGQIFAGLGQGALPSDELERLFVTPHEADLEQLCAAAGSGHTRVERSMDFVAALDAAAATGSVQIVQVAIDAERDRERRADLHEAVDEAIAGIGPR